MSIESGVDVVKEVQRAMVQLDTWCLWREQRNGDGTVFKNTG